MITWNNTKTNPPEDKQSCFLTQARGLISQPIIGPIAYSKENDHFLDLFAEPDHGTILRSGARYAVPDLNLYWCDEKEINLPEEEPEE
jgi:hypothetical protein|tara:strand:- start:4921 stop:5184 length:264 start_codon:yes stop_codon:yes gene_type:complete